MDKKTSSDYPNTPKNIHQNFNHLYIPDSNKTSKVSDSIN